MVMALGALVGAVSFLVVPPRYVSEAVFLVSSHAVAQDDLQTLNQGATFAQQQAASYAAVVTSKQVLQPVIDDIPLDTSVDALARSVTVDVRAGSAVVRASVTNRDPALVEEITRSLSAHLEAALTALEQEDPEAPARVDVRVLQSASAARYIAWPQLAGPLLGALAGGLACTLWLVRRRSTDSTLKDAEAVRRALAALPVLGTVPVDMPAAQGRTALDVVRLHLEARRELLTTGPVVVTAAATGVDSTAIAAALADALHGGREDVCLVDADLRRSSEDGTDPPGLTDALASGGDGLDLVRRTEPGPALLPRGRRPPNPQELLLTLPGSHLLTTLVDRYAWVIVHASPLAVNADAALLGRAASGVVLVVPVGAHVAQLASSLRLLVAADAPVIGVVVADHAQRTSDRVQLLETVRPA